MKTTVVDSLDVQALYEATHMQIITESIALGLLCIIGIIATLFMIKYVIGKYNEFKKIVDYDEDRQNRFIATIGLYGVVIAGMTLGITYSILRIINVDYYVLQDLLNKLN